MILKKSWYFLKQQNGLKYFPGATEAKSVKTKCKFYNYETRTPIPSEEVFDKYLIPYIFGNMFTDNINVKTTNAGNSVASNGGTGGIQLKEILNDDVRITSGKNKMYSSNVSVVHIKLDHLLNEANVCFLDDRADRKGYASNFGLSSHAYSIDSIFKEKYQGQFEIDLENKILYRTVRSFTGYPSSIIDIKYSIPTNLKDLKHPTTKPVEVLEYLIDRYTEEGDNVLDMTMRQRKYRCCL